MHRIRPCRHGGLLGVDPMRLRHDVVEYRDALEGRISVPGAVAIPCDRLLEFGLGVDEGLVASDTDGRHLAQSLLGGFRRLVASARLAYKPIFRLGRTSANLEEPPFAGPVEHRLPFDLPSGGRAHAGTILRSRGDGVLPRHATHVLLPRRDFSPVAPRRRAPSGNLARRDEAADL
mmetsp:Transcript_30899/g.61453  ORF Transcript_30899/g.61453 Transcript_30899/m.61453 type:complete len:176 (-) Transcript_30899:151-678(-)